MSMMENEENSNNTDDDRQSAEMNEEHEDEMQSNQSDYTYQEEEEDINEDEEYQYEDDDKDEETYIKTYIGMQYDGNMNEMMKLPGKNALYPIYKQLSEYCLVDIDIHFYSAQLTIGIKEQILMLIITFPSEEPYFPIAPPKIVLQSKFKYPNQKYNILFNCHPLLLSSTWNICTDIVQIIKDIINITETSIIDTIDETYYTNNSIERIMINLINNNLLDITSLFPDNIMNKLPSFGIIKLKNPNIITDNTNITRPRGVGYSDGHGGQIESWKKSNEISILQLDGLLELSKRVQKEIISTQESNILFDTMFIDGIYFILTHTISRTIPLEEFFRNLSFYTLVIECILPLPAPSEHIVPIQSLLNVYNVIMNSNMSNTLEAEEVIVLDKLKVLKERFELSKGSSSDSADVSNSAASITTTATTTAATVVDIDNSNNSSRSSSSSMQTRSATTVCSKKRQLSPVSTSNTSTTTTSSSASNMNKISSTTATTTTLLTLSDIPRVTELEHTFISHKYTSDMSTVTHMNAKWLRRLYIELGTMPESLPENVLVFTGTQCSQPNLMKIIMFPESRDCPYCGGGFIFDVFIPSDYPAVPPKVNLITTGKYIKRTEHMEYLSLVYVYLLFNMY